MDFEGMQQLLTSIPMSLYRRLKIQAAKDNASIRYIVMTALKEYLDKQEELEIPKFD